MASTRRPSDGLLARVNFPLYAVEMLTSRHVLVAGGGGSSKTGVANGFEIYEIYHNGSHFCALEVLRHETGENVVMNFAVASDGRRAYLCAGQESHCQMYIVNACVTNEDGSEQITSDNDDKNQTGKENGLRYRKNTNSNDEDLPNGHANNSLKEEQVTNAKENLKRILKFTIKSMDSVQTDFLNKEPLQRVVRISPNGQIMATGGTDGHLRTWSFPQMQRLADIEAHKKEIDDIDFSPDSKYIVTIAKDGKGYVWDALSTNKCYDLKWKNSDENHKFLYKRCRYGTIEGQRDQYRLYCIVNQVGKVGKQHGYLQKWDGCKKQLDLSISHKESLASLAVRDDGRFVAIGTMFSGSIYMYIAFSLQCVLCVPDAHSMFVTGLQFLPVTNEKGPPISSDSEAAVISISVDNKVCIHSLQQRRMMPVWLAVLFIVIVLYGAFVLCLYLGL